MQLNATDLEGIQVVSLSGRFDAHETSSVNVALDDAIAHGKVVVDLAGVNFIDSSALSALVQAMKHARERGGDLMLATLQSPVRIIFELTRLDMAFSIHPTVEEAVGAIRA